MDMNVFQRVGARSNTHTGNDFEGAALAFFAKQGITLTKNFSVPVAGWREVAREATMTKAETDQFAAAFEHPERKAAQKAAA